MLSGGLFSGPRALPVAAHPHIPAANQLIAAATGVTFGDAYRRALAEGTVVMDSTDASTGLVALSRQAPGRILELASALQRAFAAGHGLDAHAVAEAFLDPATRAEAEDGFRELRRLGVDAYPTLLLHTPPALTGSADRSPASASSPRPSTSTWPPPPPDRPPNHHNRSRRKALP